MRLSVVMPVYNHGQLLQRAVDAIVTQSLPPAELIIINDGSTDNTAKVLKDLALKHTCIYPITLPTNQGTYAAVKHGRNIASADYIYFAAADDEVMDGFFSSAITFLEKHKALPFCSAMTDDVPVPIPHRLETTPSRIDPIEAAKLIRKHGTWFRCNTAIYRRDIIEGLDGFDPTLGPFGDGFLCMMLALRDGCGFIPKVFCSVNVEPKSNSQILNNSPEELAAVFQAAEQQMQRRYRSVFPESVVTAWGSQWRYTIAGLFIRQPRPIPVNEMAALSPRLSKFDIKAISALKNFCPILARAYTLFRLSPTQFFQRIGAISRA